MNQTIMNQTKATKIKNKKIIYPNHLIINFLFFQNLNIIIIISNNKIWSRS